MERRDYDLLTGFKMVLRETYRDDLDEGHREYVDETLFEIAKNCVNEGLGRNLAKIKDEIDLEEKLIKLKRAWEAGEVEA